MDDSREVSHEEKFDPLSQIERSKQIESDQDATNETKSSEPVSVAQNMPNQGSGQSGEPGKASTNNSRNGQTINYEINSVRSDRVREAGELKRMTIAVVVDGITDDKGHYQERAQDELTRLSELIQSAVGFDANRGDRVTVETMRFMPETPIGTAADADPRQFGQTPVTWIAIGGTVALVLVGGMLMMRKRGKARSGEWDEDGAAPMPYLSSDFAPRCGYGGSLKLAAGVDGQLRPALAAAGMAEKILSRRFSRRCLTRSTSGRTKRLPRFAPGSRGPHDAPVRSASDQGPRSVAGRDGLETLAGGDPPEMGYAEGIVEGEARARAAAEHEMARLRAALDEKNCHDGVAGSLAQLLAARDPTARRWNA